LAEDSSDRVLVDIDDTIIEVHGYAKQGSAYGYSGVRGLNALLATASTPGTAPVVVAQRLRKGSCGSPRGAARLVADALKTTSKLTGASKTSPGGRPLVRADSALCRHRHNADYAEVLVMPMSTPDPLRLAVIEPLRSA